MNLIRRSYRGAGVVRCETKCSSSICEPIHSHLHLIVLILLFSEARNRNVLIRSKFPQERITPVFRPINIEFRSPQSPTDSPRVGPAGGGYNPSPSQKFPETLGALIKMSLSDSTTLMMDYGLGADVSDKKVPEEARLDNLNKLMLHFGVSFLPFTLPTFAHLPPTRRSAIDCILALSGKGQS